MKWPLRILLAFVWLWIGIVGNLPPCFMFISTAMQRYAWPMPWLHGPDINYHSGFPFMHIDTITLFANGSFTIEFVYWKLVFDIAFVLASTFALCVMIGRMRQFSILTLLVLVSFTAAILAICQYLKDQFAMQSFFATAMYSLPMLYCLVTSIRYHYLQCFPAETVACRN